MLALIGGLFQINPVWLYGPFVPYTAPRRRSPTGTSAGSRVRCGCGRTGEFHVFGVTIPGYSCPGVVVPGLMFTVLALWPFIEARVTHDHETHHFAQHPSGAAGPHRASARPA